MAVSQDWQSKHFTLESLADGVYACIHKEGGAAYTNTGIIDLGDRTIVVDAFNTRAAGTDLRKAAESLFNCPVDTILLTHCHSDHWVGASAFEPTTTLLTTQAIRKETLKWGRQMLKDFQNPSEWEEYIEDMEKRLQTEKDERVRVGLDTSIIRTRYTMAEMTDIQLRYADETFEKQVIFKGSERSVEVVDYGSGHSSDDIVVLLPQNGIAFIGDIGFFEQQPFMGYCNLDKWRVQIKQIIQSDYEILIPGHGPIGNKASLTQQLDYFDVMEDLIGAVVEKGGSFKKALQIDLPEPFNGWLMGGMGRYEVNVRYLYKMYKRKRGYRSRP